MHETGSAIGIFDSGVGGVSVLKELVKSMPTEHFIYYADSANAPYGLKSVSEVENLSLQIADYLIVKRGVKALVVACNTATSAAVNVLRHEYSIPIIGMEPALKPAVIMSQGGQVLVMATPMTIGQKKFQKLLSRYGELNQVIPLPCPGLVELIEAGNIAGEKVRSLLKDLFNPLDLSRVKIIVLGCTHYSFVKAEIASLISQSVAIIDGNQGTAKQVRRVLEERGLLSPVKSVLPTKQVEWVTSGSEKELILLGRFFETDLRGHSSC